MITVKGPLTGQSAVADKILRALPDWFGVEEATLDYIAQADVLPTFVAYHAGEAGETAVGFLTLRQHSPDAGEISVMGVLPTVQRQGVGRALVDAAEAHLRRMRIRFLQVKTLSPRHPDAGYAETRAFYQALGFCWLEEFPDLWDSDNPCLQLIKYIEPKSSPKLSL